MLPEWLSVSIPYLLVVYPIFFLGIGLPWAYALLPRSDWQYHPTVLALALATGPIFGTTWLLFIGTFATFDLPLVIFGVVALAATGIGLSLRTLRTQPAAEKLERTPISLIEWVLIAVLVIGFGIHVLSSAYWPFIQYDTLWTFGYNPRLFLTTNEIPDSVAYYPQLVPLTYSFSYFISQEINDHIARAAVPWFMLAGIMMAYTLGARVWLSRRIGLITAAFYFLMPHALWWTRTGDLEMIVPIYFTGATLFFVLAWRHDNYRYAVISGLMCAGALYTKPTAGSWPLGVMLLTGLTFLAFFVSPKVDREYVRRKFSLAFITGVVTIPIGGMWYVRNVLLGHDPIDLPPSYWNTLAEKSGRELGWLLVIAAFAVALGFIRGEARRQRNKQIALIGGFILMLIATIPSAIPPELPEDTLLLNIFIWLRNGFNPGRAMTLVEGGLLFAGMGLIAWGVLDRWQATTDRVRQSALLLLTLSLPFMIVWFFNYSYHYRLTLTVIPVVAAMAAALLDSVVFPWAEERRNRLNMVAVVAFGTAVIGPAVVGFSFVNNVILNPIGDTDADKYSIENESVVVMANLIEDRDATAPEPLRVHSFNEMRMPFFFPGRETLQRTNDLYEMPADLETVMGQQDLLIAGTHAEFFWDSNNLYPNQMAAYMNMAVFYSGQDLDFNEGASWWPYSTPVPRLGTRPPLRYGPQDAFWPLPLQMEGYHFDNLPLVAYSVHEDALALTIDDVQPTFTLSDLDQNPIQLSGIEMRDAETHSRLPLSDNRVAIEANSRIYVQLYWERTTPDVTPAPSGVQIRLIDPETGTAALTHEGLPAESVMSFEFMAYPGIFLDRHPVDVPEGVAAGVYDLEITLTAYDTPAYTVENAITVSE